MNYIDTKYISLVSHRLRNFAKKKDYLWNFSCPYCGDSQKNRRKARGFIYRIKSELFYKCHNCSIGTTLPKLFEFLDPELYKEYTLEKYKEGQTSMGRGGAVTGQTVPTPEFKFETPKFKKRLGDLKTFNELEKNHPAIEFLSKRLIPRDSWNDIYFCPNFFEFTNSLVPNKFPSLLGDHPRIMIPFRKENGEIFAYQGRAFGNEPQKYITVVLDSSHPKIFGMDRVDFNDMVYVVEGPIDSLFISNCVAVAQSDLRLERYKENVTLIPDNEPRNREVVKQIEKFIGDGYRVVLWPNDMSHKDINDMILSGMTQNDIQSIIHNNTHSGLQAKVEFSKWKRI